MNNQIKAQKLCQKLGIKLDLSGDDQESKDNIFNVSQSLDGDFYILATTPGGLRAEVVINEKTKTTIDGKRSSESEFIRIFAR